MGLSEKQKWFNSLRLEIRQTEGDKFERTCDCGETVWYEYECPALYSWVDIHFSHGQKNTDSEAEFGYDFSKPIKFSKAGFILFSGDFGLFSALGAASSETQCELDVYRDAKENFFVFYPNYLSNPVKNDYEGVYVTFDHILSRVKSDRSENDGAGHSRSQK